MTAQTIGCILLVDDNPTNLEVLFNSLSNSGFKLLIAEDGESAIALAHEAQPDMILLDVMMPGLDGFTTCQRLKADAATQAIPILFMTALSETIDKVKGLSLGAVDYITKPFQPEEVLARVKTHIALRQLQHQLQVQNQQLQQEIAERQQAEQALRFFLHAVSHDLRNPVTGTLLILNQLRQQAGEQAQIGVSTLVLDRLLQGCDRQLKLINSLVETQANELTGIRLQPCVLPLHPFIQQLTETWEPLIAQKQATLINAVPATLPPVHADPDQLWRVFENLIANALKHNSPGLTLRLEATVKAAPTSEVAGGRWHSDIQHQTPDLEIRVQRQSIAMPHSPSWVTCRVSDNGRGIPPEQMAELFELYKRGRSAYRTQGLGIGLYLCRQIIQAHGGEIGIAPQAKGTTFWFTLPAIAAGERAIPA
ncbi:hybrid sensor histidine kinase/response regulator [Trichothermofontia sichuanensis B231]|uniref:hybrid sensor histidine kinase/response regulator n=1 Tax=Trichothermofontia sichuanensis TaxID=3045816 RepID=UPI002245E721|nr:hybrid sensor histidine kinase/response regulator [Trichothermofontia sichuanensis]UZQ53308.1 hybrid sensor histidine kinase/response regulator [Trichothermofontia sichuanensis B231]